VLEKKSFVGKFLGFRGFNLTAGLPPK